MACRVRIMFQMFDNVIKWYELVWISIIKISNRLIVFWSTNGNRSPSLVFFENDRTLNLKVGSKQVTNLEYRYHDYGHLLNLAPLLMCYRLVLITHVLAPLNYVQNCTKKHTFKESICPLCKPTPTRRKWHMPTLIITLHK